MQSDKIFIAPYNDVANFLRIELQRQGLVVSGYADGIKIANNIVHYSKIPLNSEVYLYSPNYKDQILPQLSHCQVTLVYFIGGRFYFLKSKNLTARIWFELMKEKFCNAIHRKTLECFYKFGVTPSSKYKGLKKLLVPSHTSDEIFIVGNGPSLRVSDLEKLKGKTTIACNKIYLCFNETAWRPDHYVIEDPLDIFEYLHEFKIHGLTNVYAPDDCLKYTPFDVDISYYNTYKRNHKFDEIGFESDPKKGFFKGESVVYAMFQLASFLGAKRIYLIGFDHNYVFPENTKDNLYKVSEGENNHFHKDYRKKGDIWTEPRIDNITRQFEIAREYLASKGVNVYNITRGGNLNAFPRKNTDETLG